MALTMLSIHQAAQNLLDCVCESLDRVPAQVPGLAGCPCRTGVVAGTPAADGCDGSCADSPDEYPGQLTVHTVRTYVAELSTYTNLQAVRLDGTNCGPGALTVVDLLITLWRCAPGPTDEGCPPTMAELEATAIQQHVDMMAVTQAVTCCYADTDTTRRKGRRYSLGQSLALGPQGGCVGFQTTVTVALDGLSAPVLVAP
jgi:hypothetical protein